MMRTLFLISATVLWIGCVAMAMLTIIPLAAMSVGFLITEGGSAKEWLEGVGFVFAAVVVVAALFACLTRGLLLFSKGIHASNQ